MTGTYLLYGVPASYFTAKVRAYLRKQRLDFEERSSAHPEFGQTVYPATRRFLLPVLQWPCGDIVQDSDDIIERLEREEAGRLSCHPPGPVQNVLSHLFNLFGSEGLMRLAMHYRWSCLDQQDSFIAEGFIHGIAPESPPEEAETLARPMMNKLAGYLEPLGVSDASIPAIEQAYDELLSALQAHFTKHPCLFGAWPSLGDYGLFGALSPHLGRDPVPAQRMKSRAAKVYRWTERMAAPNLDIPEYPSYPHTAFLPDDEIPETLDAVGRVAAGEMLPEFADQMRAFNAWAEHQAREPGQPVLAKPHQRSATRVTTAYRGTAYATGVPVYRIYLIQKLQTAASRLSVPDRERLEAWFERTGLRDLLEIQSPYPVRRAGHLEVWA
ncbi:glutathione S-transferase [Marinicauda algicola]|uniref:Glutathione S-transferase n=1 Tax=Marinicauda algicola TaxID=2029849 RepID=A0A4V3RXQ5_9PROT|nr:glutathione S-transferase N-terminal domain-containing protein [Marinicauda algicola]TGY87269.1 glutathione S-transferase [Marinicauda algicola]